MKKSLLICLLVVVLCASMLFAACAPALEAETLEAMKEMLYQMYKEGNPANTYEVVGIVTGKGEKANVQWSVSVTSGDQNAVKVGSYDEESKKVTIEVDPEPAADVAYTLTATLVNEKGKAYEIDGQPVSISFERSLKAFKVNTYAEYLAACQANNGAGSDEQIRIKGYVIGVVCMESSSKGSLYIQDAEGHGYYAYAPVDATKDCETTEQLRAKWPIGTEVYVTGTVTTYNGQYEFNKNCEVRATGKTATAEQIPYVDATAAFAAATSNEDTALAEYQNRRVTLKDAIITRVDITLKDGKYDKVYYYFTLPGSEVEFNVYYTIYFIDEATMLDLHEKLVVGKKVDLTGVISVYSKDFQVYPDSANSVSNVRDVTYTDAEKIAAAKKNLSVVDTAVEGDVIELPATGALETTITWALDGEYTNVTLADGKLTVNEQIADTVVVKLVATIASGSASENVTFEVTVPAARTSFIKAALNAGAALADGSTTEQSYMIIGTLSEIDSEYSEQYKNVSFYVQDAEGNKILVYRYNLEDAATVKVGDFIAFAAPIKNYKGTIEAVATFEALDITTLADAAAAGLAGTGEAGTQVYGYVKSIDSAYSAQYGNITVTISDGTNDFYIYRLKGGEDIMVGDYLLITGTPSQYKNAAQMAQGATYVKSPIHVATPVEPAEKVTTIEAALSAAVGTPAELTGTVVRYNSADYKDSYYIKDEAGKEILVYRANAEANIGDVIKVVGTIGAYNGVNQIAQGSTVTVITPAGGNTPAHECESKCPTCGKCLDEDCTEAACAEKCEGHEPVVAETTYTLEVPAKGASWTEDTLINDIFYVSNKVKTESVKIDGATCDGLTFSSQFSLTAGKVQVNDGVWSNSIFFTVPAGQQAKVVLYAAQKADKTTSLKVMNAAGETVAVSNLLIDGASADAFNTLPTTAVSKYEFTLAEGTYHIGGAGGGAYVYGMKVTLSAAQAEEPAAVVINGQNYSEAQAEEALLALKAGDVVVINTNGTIAKEYTFVAANYTIGEGAQLAINANAVAPAGAKLAVSAGSKIVVGAGATIDLSALTQEDFSTSTEARLVIAADAKVIMPAYTEQLWNDKYLNAVIVAMVADSEVGAQLVLGETTLTKTASGWEAESESGSSIADVLAGKEGDAVKFEGTVSEIYQAWDSYYKNMSFYVTDGTNRVLVFRAGTQVGVGDYVSVDGKVTMYQEKPQIAQGATVVIKAVHECNEFTPADCLNAAACTVCGKVNGEALGHTEANAEGKCDRCGASVGAAAGQQFTATKTMKELITALGWTSSTTKQSFTLDDNVSVKINGGSNTGKAYNGDHIRVYATDSPAGTITISVPAGYELVSVKISTQTGTYAYLQVAGNDATDLSNTVVSVSGQSVVFNSVKNGSDGKQVRVTAIEVVYVAVAE